MRLFESPKRVFPLTIGQLLDIARIFRRDGGADRKFRPGPRERDRGRGKTNRRGSGRGGTDQNAIGNGE